MDKIKIILFLMSMLGSWHASVSQKMEADYASMVNTFLGVDECDDKDGIQIAPNLPRIDTSWFDVREIFGATHPGATLPFGMVSTGAMGRLIYKKGYPTGYNGQDFYGLTHFHSSGPGTIRWYYNYLLFAPHTGKLRIEKKKQKIISEKASPGYYSCQLDSKIKVGTSVAYRSAVHSFTFPQAGNNHLVIDLSNYYKALDSARVVPEKFPESVSAEFVSPTQIKGKIVMDGFPIFFYLELDQKPSSHGFFNNFKKTENQSTFTTGHTKNCGLYFTFDNLKQKTLVSRIGFSFKSEEKAKANLKKDITSWQIEETMAKSRTTWNRYLSKIEVTDQDQQAVDQFYSSLYKAILKPANLQGENPFWEGENYVSDLATSWDIYATQLPLVFTFFPEEGQKIAQFYIDLYNQFGRFPPAYLMKEGMPWVFSKQASALGNFILADAHAKNIPGIHWPKALEVMVKTVNNERGEIFQKGIALAPSPTHNQDYAYAAFCAARVAEKTGNKKVASEMMAISDLWKPMYDADGILKKFDQMETTELYPRQHFNFYEGNRWNYTYRIWQNMQGLIAMQGGEDSFIQNLDWYYNLTPNTTENQFQGLNNEVDYCSPYAYLYAGRPDRTQQILRIAMQYRFRNTRGGLPGNDDAGAMTSWYVWNAIGLFPISGQDILLIGSPKFESVRMNTKNPFVVRTNNNSTNNIYVQSARLNGLPLDRPFLYFSEFYAGGELVLEMGDQPSTWGSQQRPPSYSSEYKN